ncbi:MAG: hypothetical protein AAF748_07805 [Pseudomonadota bacterium]
MGIVNKRGAVALAAWLLASTVSATAQNQPPDPVGQWRCVMNSVTVSIDVAYQINPDGSLFGQGSIVYNQTSAIYQVQGGGRWLAGVDPSTGRFTYQFGLQPPNHASFSIFTEPTGDPNALYQLRPNMSAGGSTETACSRLR